jgi:lactoylglutathione lyase
VHLNHINLTVTDVEAAKDFLSKYFGLKDQGGNKGMAFLSDSNGLLLSLMKAKGNVTYPATFHIGFGQVNDAKVDEIYARLIADGYQADPPQHLHGYTFYIEAPGGFTVEVLS